ncbi:helix-turn-helix transcriptional regulator [Chloroflexales bacterium ZM16-3]|nr:helix-turn-helix transcriptional regulator [Chloroflexales bacterium ZM16-3]
MAAVEPIDRTVGQRIAAAREEHEMSQRAFAVKLGWPYSTLANYESGRRRLTLVQLAHIARVLGRSPASFLVESPTAALLIDRIGTDEEVLRQVAYFLDTLDDPLPEPPD